MDAPVCVGRLACVHRLVLAKRHVADDQIEERRGQLRLLQSAGVNLQSVGRETCLEHCCTHLIEFDRSDIALCRHFLRHTSDDVTNAG